MRSALDTNILAYAEGVNDKAKQDQSLDLVKRLSTATGVLPVQALGELFSLLVRKREKHQPTLDTQSSIGGMRSTTSEILP